jgi:hydrogenase large subunit
MAEAPRGALAHWIVIKDKKIENYQMVVPSTWNASPRDSKGQRSSYEEALIGTPVADPEQPLEILRTIHSFDPCVACAVHLYDTHGRHLSQIVTY